ncbi:hypothetical protein B0J18DRAFT_494462 [Chaetomium sp. MPI-SDFR-AT-0129]|nr:hypothetical protein B0J18DRAFT_494462 [Chaetomium sp. MPI-SDFR-AT-0129]
MAESSNVPHSSVGGGGFIPALPSPAPTTSTTTSLPSAGLPHPRSRALRPGSSKEDQVRNFVSERMAHITRRFIKKVKTGAAGDEAVEGDTHVDEDGDDGVEGYSSVDELSKDLDEVIGVVWLSGTPNIQIPSLLNIASEFNTWMAGLPASATPVFRTLHKLDHCFASLLSGEDIETHESLPGFENGLRSGMSRTDMVRCKSMVQNARVVVVDVMSRRHAMGVIGEAEGEPTEDTEDSGLDGPGGTWNDEGEEDLYMDVARVYEHTLVKLGDTLGESGVADVEMSAD